MSGVDMGLWNADSNDDGATAYDRDGVVPSQDKPHSTWKPGVGDMPDNKKSEMSSSPSQVGNDMGNRETVPFDAVAQCRDLGVDHALYGGHGGYVLPGNKPD